MLKKLFTTFVFLIVVCLSSATTIKYMIDGKYYEAADNDTITIPHGNSLFVTWDINLHQGPFSHRIYDYQMLWSEWSDNNFVFFDYIEPGNYLLEIKNNKTTISSVKVIIEKANNLASLPFILIAIMASVATFGLGLAIRKSKETKENIPQPIEPASVVVPAKEDDRTSGNVKSQKYKKVTVLFADIQGFTKIVEHMNPEQLIDELDKYFIYFDEVAEKFNIEKIKTIGDAYMCAGGLPEKNRTNPIDVVLAGMAMQRYVKSIHHTKSNNELGFWELRVGIHTGSVISGMIGNKKRYFDIWGDSVNIASRMESSGIAGEINITGVTYNLIKDFFVCEYRGKMPVKYKGETDMYFVRSIVPSLSEQGKGKVPNKLFYIRLQHNSLLDMIDYIEEVYPGHCIAASLFKSFQIIAETLARAERVSDEELLKIKCTAIFTFPALLCHKIEDGNRLNIEEIMEKFRFEADQIKSVIFATHNLVKENAPTGIIEQIISDSFILMILKKNFVHEYKKLVEKEEKNRTFSNFHRNDLEKMVGLVTKYRPFTSTFNHLAEVRQDSLVQIIKHFLIFDNRTKQN